MKAEWVCPVDAELGEGATSFPDGSIWWVDLLRGRTFQWLEGTNLAGPKFGHEVAKLLPGEQGLVVVGREFVESIGQKPRKIARLAPSGSNLRGSDSVVLPDGSLVCGVVDRDLTPGRGALLWIHRDEVEVIVTGADIPNGLAVMPEGRSVVWTDSPTRRLDVFDIDDERGLVERRPFALIPEEYGVPDGLCVDDEGGVWVAMWGGGKVIRVDEQGRIDAVAEVGVPHVTSCAFTPDGKLLVTTASVALSPQEREHLPGAGGLWSVDTGSDSVRAARTYLATCIE